MFPARVRLRAPMRDPPPSPEPDEPPLPLRRARHRRAVVLRARRPSRRPPFDLEARGLAGGAVVAAPPVVERRPRPLGRLAGGRLYRPLLPGKAPGLDRALL